MDPTVCACVCVEGWVDAQSPGANAHNEIMCPKCCRIPMVSGGSANKYKTCTSVPSI